MHQPLFTAGETKAVDREASAPLIKKKKKSHGALEGMSVSGTGSGLLAEALGGKQFLQAVSLVESLGAGGGAGVTKGRGSPFPLYTYPHNT